MAHQYVQLPPDSTGKKLFHRAYIDLDYDNGTSAFSVGDRVVCETSGLNGDIINVEGTVSSGTIHIVLTVHSPTSITDDENLQVNGVTYATVNGTGNLYYVPGTVILGANDNEVGSYVDKYGAMYTRSPEGHFQLDAFGRLQVSQITHLGDYIHTYDKLPNEISEEITGAATSTYNANVPCVKMAVTDSTADSVIRTTDLYHKYQSGVSQLIEMTLWHGDAGKSGNRRRWGYFDENNGLFFELQGTTLYIVIRSKATGSIVETKIAQENWNRDHLDGAADAENLSGYTLDLTKGNIFFIDFQWLGVGRVRFGVNIDGQRIVCHEHNHANTYSRTYMGTGSLPLRWENINVLATSGTSEMNVICSTVQTEGRFDIKRNVRSHRFDKKAVDTNWTYIGSIRPSQLDASGKANRTWIVPRSLHLFSTDQAVEYRIFVSVNNLTGFSWQSLLPIASAEIDMDSTSVVMGIPVISGHCSSGESKDVIATQAENLNAQVTKLIRRANINDDPFHLSLECRAISGSTTVYTTLDWFEVI